MQLTKNFNSVTDNMACPCCGSLSYRQEFLDRVQILRDLLATPFYLDQKGGGFYRCRDYNTEIGGAPSSQHLLGNAMDIYSLGWDGSKKWEFISEATKLRFSLGVYESFFHVDYRPDPVMWYG